MVEEGIQQQQGVARVFLNANRSVLVGREMQIELDGQSVISTMDSSHKESKKIPMANEMKIHLDSLTAHFRPAGYVSKDKLTV